MRKKIFAIVFILACFSSLDSASVWAKSADPDLSGIRKLVNDGQYDAAKTELNEIISAHAQFAPAYFERGMVYLSLQEPSPALADFDKAIELDEKYALAYTGRASIFFQQKNLEATIQNLNTAVKLDPNLGLAYYNRGIAFYHKGEYAKAMEDLGKAMGLGVTVEEDLLNEVWEMSRRNEVLDRLTREINKNPQSGEAFYNRALLYYYREDFQNAWADAQKAETLGYPIDKKFMKEVQELYETSRA